MTFKTLIYKKNEKKKKKKKKEGRSQKGKSILANQNIS